MPASHTAAASRRGSLRRSKGSTKLSSWGAASTCEPARRRQHPPSPAQGSRFCLCLAVCGSSDRKEEAAAAGSAGGAGAGARRRRRPHHLAFLLESVSAVASVEGILSSAKCLLNSSIDISIAALYGRRSLRSCIAS